VNLFLRAKSRFSEWGIYQIPCFREPSLSGAILFRVGSAPHNTSLAASSCLEGRMLPMLGGDLYEIAFCIDYRGFVVSVPSEPRACHYLNSRRLHRLHETINGIA